MTAPSAKAAHTALPWEAHPPGVDWARTTPETRKGGLVGLPKDISEVGGGLDGNDGKIICRCYGPDHEANAELIVRATNNHAELLAALTEAREACDAMAFIWDDSRFPAEMRKEYAAQFVNLLFPAIRNTREAIRKATA